MKIKIIIIYIFIYNYKGINKKKERTQKLKT